MDEVATRGNERNCEYDGFAFRKNVFRFGCKF